MTGELICAGIEKALCMEKTGQRFYMKCAAASTHPTGRGMFESYAKCCRVNLEKMERLYASYYKKEYCGYLKKPDKPSECAFSQDVPAGSMESREGILAVLSLSLKAEEEAYGAYGRLSDAAQDKTLKKFFSGLAGEKAEHAQVILAQSAYVEGSGSYSGYK